MNFYDVLGIAALIWINNRTTVAAKLAVIHTMGSLAKIIDPYQRQEAQLGLEYRLESKEAKSCAL
jgi:hypothetical protein